MKTIPSLLLALFLPVGTSNVNADEQAPKQADAALRDLAVTKRDSVLVMRVKDRNISSYGAFISKDGLALVDMACLALNERPEIVTAADTPLKLPKILGTFPEQQLALVKFDHQPKACLKLAAKEPDVGETVALVTMNLTSAQFVETPSPMLGPVMAKRSMVTPSLRQALFARVLSFGSSISATQRDFAGPGRFAINRGGELVAFTGSYEQWPGQTLVFLLPVTELAGRIEELAKVGENLGHPIPASHNPYDLAVLDDDFNMLGSAMQKGDQDEAKAALGRLRKSYPKSTKIALMSADWDENFLRDLPEADPSDTKAHRVQLLSARANKLTEKGDFEGAIAARKAAIALSPEDYVFDRFLLAGIHGQSGRLEEAEKRFDEIEKFAPEMIILARLREMTLRQLQREKEARQAADRATELEGIYRER